MVSQVGIAFGYPAAAPAATLASCPNEFVDPCGLDENAFTWKAALNHMPNEDTLWYVSLATGYKPGGINGGLNTNPRLYKPFKEEEVESLKLVTRQPFLMEELLLMPLFLTMHMKVYKLPQLEKLMMV